MSGCEITHAGLQSIFFQIESTGYRKDKPASLSRRCAYISKCKPAVHELNQRCVWREDDSGDDLY